MLEFLKVNIPNIIVGGLVAAAAAAVIIKMIRDKRRGKTSCSCGCANCPSSGICHKK